MNILINSLYNPYKNNRFTDKDETGNYSSHQCIYPFPSFLANIKSPKLRFKQEDFFVRIYGYGKNREWAKIVKETTDKAVKAMRENIFAERILRNIALGVKKANNSSITKDSVKSTHTGIIRDYRTCLWGHTSTWNKDGNLITDYSDITRYKPYKQKLDYTIKHPLKNPYDDIRLTIPVANAKGNYLRHANYKYVNNALDRVFEIYQDFSSKYNADTVKDKDLKDINDKIAEIRWILAHSTPWDRGSDAISNVYMRAMYKSIGIKTYPLAKGISLDMEAYCTNLKDYKENFSNYFERVPKIIE